MKTLAILLSLLTNSIYSWYDKGHCIVARIAEQKLQRESPQALSRIYAMLKPLQPFFPERGNSLLEPALAPDRLVMQFYYFLISFHTIGLPYLYKGDGEGSVKFADPDIFNVTYAYEAGKS